MSLDPVLTVSEAAARVNISKAKLRALIRSGFLRAVNTSLGKRPTWAILESELQRAFSPEQKPQPEPQQRRRRRLDAGVNRVF